MRRSKLKKKRTKHNQSSTRQVLLLLGCVLFAMASCGYRYRHHLDAFLQNARKPTQQAANEEMGKPKKDGEEGKQVKLEEKDKDEHLKENVTADALPHKLYIPNATIISLSLPSTNQPVLPRYFGCGGRPPSKFGRYCTNLTRDSKLRQPIGKCMLENLQGHKPIMQDCGDYNIWQDLAWFESRSPFRRFITTELCFDPVLHPGALEALYEAMPNGIIINMIQQPKKWFQRLPYDIHERWSTWCNLKTHLMVAGFLLNTNLTTT
ncbi:expressed unknown protein [Seminavis robusta]|uniref:Uncharacterized protein n=1 Tax=Seminavis robusta TaxID=568900 RepID=A0A9N8DQV8_9STRA|nr:expressed unknown protein [Seminavis robusta]|eukprot:Sro217_g089760.1 n/a (264) ;mRNA; r:55568-56359